MSSVLRFVLFLLSRRFVQVILWFFVALYGLDWFIYGLTQRQWFASIGYENLWLTRAWAQFELFAYFLLLTLVLTRLFLGSATKLSHEEAGPLRGALVRFEPLRHGTPRVAWVIAWICGLILSRNFASHWSEWLFLQGAHRSNFVSYSGLPAVLWTHVLPILAPFLWALWYFSLVLFVLVLIAGTLRALPLLAAREPAPPSVLPRVLWSLVAWLLGLRACLYFVQILGLNRGKPLETGDVFRFNATFWRGCHRLLGPDLFHLVARPQSSRSAKMAQISERRRCGDFPPRHPQLPVGAAARGFARNGVAAPRTRPRHPRRLGFEPHSACSSSHRSAACVHHGALADLGRGHGAQGYERGWVSQGAHHELEKRHLRF